MNVLNMANLFADPLSQSNRGIRVRLWHGQTSFENVLLVKAVSGREAICDGVEYRLFCLSTQTLFPLKDLIALPVEIQFVTDQGQLRCICGLVAQASAEQSDGGLASFQLVVRDALSLMSQRVNTRVFRNLSEVDITADMIGEWRNANPILASAFDVDTSGITGTYPAREFTMQHNESDAAFLQRLWKRQGIAWCFRPRAPAAAGNREVPAHTLVLFDDAFSLPQNAARAVRFQSSSMPTILPTPESSCRPLIVLATARYQRSPNTCSTIASSNGRRMASCRTCIASFPQPWARRWKS